MTRQARFCAVRGTATSAGDPCRWFARRNVRGAQRRQGILFFLCPGRPRVVQGPQAPAYRGGGAEAVKAQAVETEGDVANRGVSVLGTSPAQTLAGSGVGRPDLFGLPQCAAGRRISSCVPGSVRITRSWSSLMSMMRSVRVQSGPDVTSRTSTVGRQTCPADLSGRPVRDTSGTSF